MSEEKQTNTTVKNESHKTEKSVSAKKIIVAVVALIVIVAIIVGILLATDVLNINLSKKSKMVAGVEKIGERLSSTIDDLNVNSKESSTSTIKIFNNLNKDSGIELSGDLSANIDTFDVSSSVATLEESKVKTVLDIINSSKIGMNIKYDGNEKASTTVNGKIKDIEVTGEAIYDGEQIVVRSEEINPKWLSISKEDIEAMLESENIDFEQIKDMLSKMTEKMIESAKSLEIDEKTQKEISERYEKVLKDFVNKKSKDIESEKDKVTVNGKSKNCNKLTLELDGDDVKKLLIDYVDTFKSDKQLQEIMNKSFSVYSDIYKEMLLTMGENSTSLPEIDNALEEILNNIDEIKDEIKDLDLDVKIILTVYATNTEVYRTDIDIITDSMEVILETTFNKEDTVISVSIKSSGIKLDVATVTIKSEKNSANIKIETTEDIEAYIGEKISFEIVCKNDDKKTELTISADLGDAGNARLSIISNIEKNEDNEYGAETTLNFDIDVKNEITTKGNIKLRTNIKTGDISIPSISSEETVDANDQTALEEYNTEAQTNIVELTDKLSKIEGLSELIDMRVPEDALTPAEPLIPDDIQSPDDDVTSTDYDY